LKIVNTPPLIDILLGLEETDVTIFTKAS